MTQNDLDDLVAMATEHMDKTLLPVLRVKKLPHGAHLPDISRGSALASGLDLYAAVPVQFCIGAGEREMVPTGIAIAVMQGFEAQVRPRSGLAAKHGVTVLNTPGTIDADYRGEIKVILHNTSTTKFWVDPGMRIAQLVIAPVELCEPTYVEDLDETVRGEGGFGSTGQ